MSKERKVFLGMHNIFSAIAYEEDNSSESESEGKEPLDDEGNHGFTKVISDDVSEKKIRYSMNFLMSLKNKCKEMPDSLSHFNFHIMSREVVHTNGHRESLHSEHSHGSQRPLTLHHHGDSSWQTQHKRIPLRSSPTSSLSQNNWRDNHEHFSEQNGVPSEKISGRPRSFSDHPPHHNPHWKNHHHQHHHHQPNGYFHGLGKGNGFRGDHGLGQREISETQQRHTEESNRTPLGTHQLEGITTIHHDTSFFNTEQMRRSLQNATRHNW